MEKHAMGAEGRRYRVPGTRYLVGLPVLAACAVALAACGGGSTTTSATTKTGDSAPQKSSSAPKGTTVPGTSGTLAAIDGTSLEVQNPESGQTTVTYTPTTTFSQTVSASLANVTVGSCISAFGAPPSGSTSSSSSSTATAVTATTVTITPASSTGCTRSSAAGGGFSGFDGKRPAGSDGKPPAGFDGKPPAGAHFPKGSHKGFAGFGGAFGSVTAVSGSSVTVQETNPSTKKVEDVTVTVTSSTTFSQTETATSSSLAVGQCVRAIGPADDTGAVTASSISLSTAGPDGCSAGFGGGGFGGGGSSAGTSGASDA